MSFWRDAQWWVIGALGIAALVLGFVGFRDYEAAVGASTAFWDVFYRDLQLFVLNSGALQVGPAIPVSLEIARLLAPTVAGVALIRAFAPLFRDQLQLVRFRAARGHVVVCGLGRKGLLLARSLREQGYQVVAVERDDDDHTESCRTAGVPVFVGDATDVATLRKAGTGRAGFVVALCPDDVNAGIAVSAHRLAAKATKPVTCLLHVVDPRLSSLLRARYLAVPDTTPFRLDFFNIFERGAQALLIRYPAFPHDDPPDPGPPPHLLVVGLGRLGTSLVMQAARNWQAGEHVPDRRLRITVVDQSADSKVRSLLLRHRELDGICDVTPVTLDARSPEFQRGDFLEQQGGSPVTAAYVCFDSDGRSMETALVLNQRFRGQDVPIVMRAVTEAGLPSLLRARAYGEFENLHAFALLDRTCDADLLLGGTNEVIARALHDVYVEHRESAGWQYGTELSEVQRTDPALAPWGDLAESLRESNRDQAANTPVKLRAVGCDLEEITEWYDKPFSFDGEEVELLAEMEHERWVAERLRNQWRPGPRDPRRKRSPYLVTWGELNDDVREYDRVFVRSLSTILAKLGYRIVRSAGCKPATGS